MTNFNNKNCCSNQYYTGLIIPPWVIIGKKADISSEFEDSFIRLDGPFGPFYPFPPCPPLPPCPIFPPVY